MAAQTHGHRNPEIVERAFTELLDHHDLELIPELYAEDCAFYGTSGPEVIDRDEYGALLATYFEAFTDLSFELEETIADGDRVSVRWTAHGTHEGDLMDIPATGEPASVPGMSFLHLADGMIAEAHTSQELLGPLQQIDVIPDSSKDRSAHGRPAQRPPSGSMDSLRPPALTPRVEQRGDGPVERTTAANVAARTAGGSPVHSNVTVIRIRPSSPRLNPPVLAGRGDSPTRALVPSR